MVTLLIETNHADFLLHKDFRIGKEGEPLVVETLLGWTIMSGSYKLNKSGVTKQQLPSDQEKNWNSFSMVCWYVDSYDTFPQHHSLSSTPEENHSLNIIETAISLKKGHFEVKRLWWEKHPQLLLNRELSLKAFGSLEKKFTKNSYECINNKCTNTYKPKCCCKFTKRGWSVVNHSKYQ